MEAISKTLASRALMKAVSSSNQDPKSVSCWRCFGVGTRFRNPETGQYIDRLSKDAIDLPVVAVSCLCERRRSARLQLQHMPPAFGSPKLSRLRPRPDLHPKQVTAITFVRANPNDSYAFYGKNGVGKTHIAWALVRHAVAARRSVVACAVRDLLADFRRLEMSDPDGRIVKGPRVTVDWLRRPGRPWLLFLDEFEKARPTEFASEQLFSVLDAARSFNHQIVITSNLNAERLRDHWSRIDEIWGNSIMTRLEACHEVEMF